MEDYLKEFHRYKDVFLEFRAYKKTKKAAKERTKALNHAQGTSAALATGTKRKRAQDGSRSNALTATVTKGETTQDSSRSNDRTFQVTEEIRNAFHFHLVKMHLLTHL
jgi:hypothetical protein